MKEQILEIVDRLRAREITEKEAQNFLLFLFGVIPRYSVKKYHESRCGYNYYIVDNSNNCIVKNYVDYVDGQIIKECSEMNLNVV